MPYITPDRFRVMGFGVDLGDLEDADFAFVIERASSLVDAYCNVPVLPQKHDFRGGTITREQHRWRLPDPTLSSAYTEVGTRRVYPFHGPLKTMTQFKVMFTQNYSITIDPSNLYINTSEGWAEVISLAAVVTGIYPVGVNFGLYTPVAEINYTYGWAFTSTDERLVADDGYTFRASNQFWDISTAPTIKLNGATQGSGYTVDAYEGTVVFDALQAPDARVTATYNYTMPDSIRDATAFVIADILGDRELHQRGMGHLAQVRIAELEVTRENAGRSGALRAMAEGGVPLEAQTLLAPFRYLTAR